MFGQAAGNRLADAAAGTSDNCDRARKRCSGHDRAISRDARIDVFIESRLNDGHLLLVHPATMHLKTEERVVDLTQIFCG